MAKIRIDQLLVARGLVPTRARAQAILLRGHVSVDGARVDKAGTLVAEDVDVRLRAADHPFVSRGGVKLAGALDAFELDVRGRRCLDLGASTGGFTDCLLQRGASRVVAVDVGYGQLAHRLRTDERVRVMERTNARTLTAEAIGGAVDLTVVDASFIGIGKLAPAIARCTRVGGDLVALVKPQFEVGREVASRGKGVVRDERQLSRPPWRQSAANGSTWSRRATASSRGPRATARSSSKDVIAHRYRRPAAIVPAPA
jgi:23S rRNA (cytidine1920-2'-O)/16S rRNA (cytidine1409-2'-O)-methyltransferase